MMRFLSSTRKRGRRGKKKGDGLISDARPLGIGEQKGGEGRKRKMRQRKGEGVQKAAGPESASRFREKGPPAKEEKRKKTGVREGEKEKNPPSRCSFPDSRPVRTPRKRRKEKRKKRKRGGRRSLLRLLVFRRRERKRKKRRRRTCGRKEGAPRPARHHNLILASGPSGGKKRERRREIEKKKKRGESPASLFYFTSLPRPRQSGSGRKEGERGAMEERKRSPIHLFDDVRVQRREKGRREKRGGGKGFEGGKKSSTLWLVIGRGEKKEGGERTLRERKMESDESPAVLSSRRSSRLIAMAPRKRKRGGEGKKRRGSFRKKKEGRGQKVDTKRRRKERSPFCAWATFSTAHVSYVAKGRKKRRKGGKGDVARVDYGVGRAAPAARRGDGGGKRKCHAC